ncbi:MAG: hypothetical protein MRJ52_02625 [Nitrosomonas sp.]|nr:hypothetical protein [Nitrosomonas sp.]
MDGDDLDVENVVVSTADGRILAGTLNAESGLLTLDDGQFDDLSSGSLFNMTVTYDVTDGLDLGAIRRPLPSRVQTMTR